MKILNEQRGKITSNSIASEKSFLKMNKKEKIKNKHKMKVIKSNLSVFHIYIYRWNYPLIKTEMAAIKASAGSMISSGVWLRGVGLTYMTASSTGLSQNCGTEGFSFPLAIE